MPGSEFRMSDDLHDAYRVDKGGKPTFDRVIRGLDRLKAHGVRWNVLTTVHRANEDHGLDVYRFLRDDLGTEFVQLIPVKRDSLPAYCRVCDVRLACHGGCPKDRFATTPDGEPGLHYLCQSYQDFFRHVDRPMRFMAEALRSGRPADEVMAWVERGDRRKVSARPASL